VVAIRDIVPPPQREVFNDVYIAYELMDTDLHQIIRSNQALSEEHCQVHAYIHFYIAPMFLLTICVWYHIVIGYKILWKSFKFKWWV